MAQIASWCCSKAWEGKLYQSQFQGTTGVGYNFGLSSPEVAHDSRFHVQEIPMYKLFPEELQRDLPGGPVVRSLPAGTEDMGWIPGLERFHMLGGN